VPDHDPIKEGFIWVPSFDREWEARC
jgi:hypothetical protein